MDKFLYFTFIWYQNSVKILRAEAVGIGVVVQDDQGRVTATLNKRINSPLGAVEAEAKAFEASLQFTKDNGVQDFILERDSLIIYQALLGLAPSPSSMDSLILGVQDFYREFRRVSFSHARRQDNMSAHLLAKHVKSIVDFST